MNSELKNFISSVSQISSPNSFNPYRDVCEIADTVHSPRIRKSNLTKVLKALIEAPSCSLWIGRDLGYRGGRRTGVALTDEEYLHQYAEIIGSEKLEKATLGPVMRERTANVVQGFLSRLSEPVFMWNVFPLHPFMQDKPMSNRKHTSTEREMSAFAIYWLIKNLKIKHIVAIGNDAQQCLTKMNINYTAIRHPSYGGQTDFVNGLEKLYCLNSKWKIEEVDLFDNY